MHFIKKSIIIWPSIILFFPMLLQSQQLKPFAYVSPGLSLGWDFSHGITFGLKVSLGVFHKGGFNNITLGATDYLMQKKKNLAQIYIDSHYGCLITLDMFGAKEVPYIFGVGGGIGFIRNEYHKWDFCKRVSLFSGCFVFMVGNIILANRKGVNFDLGLQGVCPIPLNAHDPWDESYQFSNR